MAVGSDLARRCLKGRIACADFHDDARRLRWAFRQRETIRRLLLQDFGQTIGNMEKEHHHRAAAVWRLAVETWLRRQGLIIARQNQKVSTSSPKTWSQN